MTTMISAKDRAEIERALGIIEGISCVSDIPTASGLARAVDIIEKVINSAFVEVVMPNTKCVQVGEQE